MSDTVFALSSGAGRAGIAILRVSGPRALEIANTLSGLNLEPRVATFAKLHDGQGELLDEALLLYFKGPHSFTGEDVLEIHCHGSPAVVKALLAELGKIEHCCTAEPGEFTRRAFLNNKMDLTEIEGLSDLLSADTDMQRRAALRETAGLSRALFTRWRNELVQAIAYIEALIDFSAEEDIPQSALADAARLLEGLAQEIQAHLSSARAAEILSDGLTVVLAGAPNTGKSSLMNALARRDMAIVTDEPGTTRDPIEVKLDLAGYPITLVDTAGIRIAQNKIEIEGIKRAHARAARADLVLWLQAPDVPARAQTFSGTTWQLHSKADLKKSNDGDVLAVSAKTGEGIEDLLDRLRDFARGVFEGDNESMLFMRERHRQLLQDCFDRLHPVITNLKTSPLEISAHELRLAAEPLERIMGFIGSEEMLGAIFERFCIGK